MRPFIIVFLQLIVNSWYRDAFLRQSKIRVLTLTIAKKDEKKHNLQKHRFY